MMPLDPRELLKALMFSVLVIIGVFAGTHALGANADIVADSTVYLENDTSQCTGVVIAPNQVLTAAHCSDMQVVQDQRMKVLPVVSVIEQPNVDAAVLTVPGVQCPCASVATPNEEKGADVRVAGFPHGKWSDRILVVVDTVPAAAWFPNETGSYIILDGPLFGGNSGGGAWQYFNGEWRLVGVVVASNRGVSTFVPLYEFKALLP